jgi:hypothetical protein
VHHRIDAHEVEDRAALRAHHIVILVDVEDVGRHHEDIGFFTSCKLVAQR